MRWWAEQTNKARWMWETEPGEVIHLQLTDSKGDSLVWATSPVYGKGVSEFARQRQEILKGLANKIVSGGTPRVGESRGLREPLARILQLRVYNARVRVATIKDMARRQEEAEVDLVAAELANGWRQGWGR